MRTILGFMFAPLAPALLFGGFPLLLGGRFGDFMWSLEFAMAIGYPVTLVAGLPLFFFLRWRRWVSLWHYAAGGMVLGVALYLFLGNTTGMPLASQVVWLSLSMCCTTIGAVVFWVIARPQPKP